MELALFTSGHTLDSFSWVQHRKISLLIQHRKLRIHQCLCDILIYCPSVHHFTLTYIEAHLLFYPPPLFQFRVILLRQDTNNTFCLKHGHPIFPLLCFPGGLQQITIPSQKCLGKWNSLNSTPERGLCQCQINVLTLKVQFKSINNCWWWRLYAVSGSEAVLGSNKGERW